MRRGTAPRRGAPDTRDPLPPKSLRPLTDAELPRDDLVEEAALACLAFVDLDLSGREAVNVDVAESRLATCRFGQGRFDRVSMSDCELIGCDLANLQARDSSMVRTSVTSCRVTGLSWGAGLLKDVRWEGCRADMSAFRFARFTRVLFTGCDLRQVDFQNADLRGVRFEDCDLSGAQFSNAVMTGARFQRCSLGGIAGVHSLRGAVVGSSDLVDLAHSLAGALGIAIEE
jgi:uncharacterized protein YjbI with pentapeptide repeats